MSEIRHITIGIRRAEKEAYGWCQTPCQRQMVQDKGKIREYTSLLRFKIGESVEKCIVIKCNIIIRTPKYLIPSLKKLFLYSVKPIAILVHFFS